MDATLRIGDKCVTLETAEGQVLVVWPSESTTWDPTARTITYDATDDGSEVVLRDGDRMQVGGGGWSEAESEGDRAEWAGSMEWLRAPSDECLADVRFLLGTLRT